MRSFALSGLLLLASCHSPTDDAIADLRHRVSVLEKAQAAGNGTAALHYQLVAPSLLSEDRYYATDAGCYEAKARLLADAANQAATTRVNSSTGSSYRGSSSFWQRLSFYRSPSPTPVIHMSSQSVPPSYDGSSTTAPFISCIPVH